MRFQKNAAPVTNHVTNHDTNHDMNHEMEPDRGLLHGMPARDVLSW